MPAVVPDLSWIVLPDLLPAAFTAAARAVEATGARTLWTYDHLSWRDMRDGPWFGAVPLLAAAAAVTDRVRLGTQVASPNFRHPVPFAKEVVTLDHVSGGRFELGIGRGGEGADATVLGGEPWPARERTERFEEWTRLLVTMLEQQVTTHRGRWWSAVDARTVPGCVQRPRVPVTVAAAGPRGMRLAAAVADSWITYGDVRDTGRGFLDAVTAQNRALDEVVAAAGRTRPLRRTAQVDLLDRAPFTSPTAYADLLAALGEAGFDEVSLHWPREDGRGVPRAALDAVLAAHS